MKRDLAACVPDFAGARVVDHSVVRFPGAVTHFSPGSYDAMLRPTTSFPNLFVAGDWVADDHGSFSQEKVPLPCAWRQKLDTIRTVQHMNSPEGRPELMTLMKAGTCLQLTDYAFPAL